MRRDFGRIIKLLILTGCRRGEVGGMKWSKLDHEKGVWVIGAGRVNNKREHRLPLPAAFGSIVKIVRAERAPILCSAPTAPETLASRIGY